MTEQEQIEEMAKFMHYKAHGKDKDCDNEKCEMCWCSCKNDAEALYNAGYRKIDEFAECRDCTAWSGTDCTRHPYTQGCLKDENNIKRQAVKYFAEKVKEKALSHCRNINCYELKFIEETIDELLKEYEK